ncbi:hypothetical protein RDWZM_005336 [Blomia tropicalis]|uniref:ABC transporter domain-containing protein n=1 Tax=Blomia tropicalis TaxID=40697 RepID=A0A9Q0M633_BLOTA|nr:hypothetical protein BLOT_005824 [Blomia tropicalis]KAJ6219524.1 hypothetical protein RDWZM_005336 [Blomia tropicalis]
MDGSTSSSGSQKRFISSNESSPQSDPQSTSIPLEETTTGSSKLRSSGLFQRQLYALLWKNYITRRVHYVSTFFEIVGPLLLPLFVCMIYSSVKFSNSEGDKPKISSPKFLGPIIYKNPVLSVFFKKEDLYENILDNGILQNKPIFRQILFTPDNAETRSLLSSISPDGTLLKPLADESQMIEKMHLEMESLSRYNVLGIVFHDLSFTDAQLSYTIYFQSDKESSNFIASKFPTKFNQVPSSVEQIDFYYAFVEAMANINQLFVSQSCIKNRKLDTECLFPKSSKRIDLYKMPYPKYLNPQTQNSFSVFDWIGLLTTLGYVLVCAMIVKRITDEKESQVKEMLRMIGMSDIVFWTSHYLNYLLFIILQAFVLIFIFYNLEVPIITNSSEIIIFGFLLIYGTQLILFSMTITTIFNRPVLAIIVTVIIWILCSTVIFRFLMPSLSTGEVIQKNPIRFLTSMTPMASFIWFFSILGDLESKTNSGLQFKNIHTTISVFGDFNVISVVEAILLSYILYFFLIFYLDNVWPFQPGVPKSPFFIFQPSYWFPKESIISDNMPETNANVHERDPLLKPKIQLQNVCKKFKTFGTNQFMAVDHLWLNIYENQLTVLLGHNGAGKTTTMNMITGMFRSTSGSIYVNRYNVFTHTNKARRSIGLCPQENVYFNELSVAQHLKLYAMLKNYPLKLLNKEINYVLELLALQDKKHVRASQLSGGMKRKLALGIAMVGGTETLILDEPTSGMDPEARRVIWDLLISLRRHRTILLTTHYMEEADVLADRIAIMNEGKLRCSGSPLFLKNAFGTGYRIRIAKSEGFNSSKFISVLQKYVSTAKLISEVETEVVYSLEGEKTELLQKFPLLFDDIEKNKVNYAIESCGLSYTTLEDVFLTVGADINVNHNQNEGKRSTYDATDAEKSIHLTSQDELVTGLPLITLQIYALICKRFNFARRYLTMLVFQLLIPASIIALALYVERKIRSANEMKTLNFNVKDLYGENTETVYSGSATFQNDFLAVNSKYGAKTQFIDESADMDTWFLDRGTQSLVDYIHNNLYGLDMRKVNPQIWFNNEQYHSAPLALLVYFETFLRSVLPSQIKDKSFIKVSGIPVYRKTDSQTEDLALLTISWVITCLIFIPIAFPFLASSYILYPIREQASKSKLIQLMTGLSPTLFWMSNFMFDMLTHLFATSILYLVIWIFDDGRGIFDDSSNAGSALFLMILFFGLSTIPVTYGFSYFFTSPVSGFTFMTILYLAFGFIANLIFSIMNILINYARFDLPFGWIEPVLVVIRGVPIFSMLYGYQKIYLLSSMTKFCKSIRDVELICSSLSNSTPSMITGCCPELCGSRCFSNENAYSYNDIGAGKELIYLVASGTSFFLFMILFEAYKLQILKIFSSFTDIFIRSKSLVLTPKQSIKMVALDSDVDAEKDRIQEEVENRNFTDLLTVYNLRKRYGNFTAVDKISFGVRPDECFGFLGVNGAGKTTTFSMLTGDFAPTSGNAFIKNGKYSLLKKLSKFQRNVGYCPQFDALLGKLTGEETLYLFARLRGVPYKSLKRDIDSLIKMVGLEEHYRKSTENYSGGNRRKLSIAIALIGSPSLIFLDEPSAGVDPAARRKIWQTLGFIKRNLNSSIVLTSHSMEECEALCSRIVIMVNGKFKCLGSTQHLRHKYGQGYSVTIRLKREHESDNAYLNEVMDKVVEYLPSALLKDYHQCLIHYHITDTEATWAGIFSQMSKLNEMFKFEDYFVSDTTLEQIFIMFARHQDKTPI